jgi:hypothetical protein
MAPLLKELPPPKLVFRKGQTVGSMVQSSTFPPRWWQQNNKPIQQINPQTPLQITQENNIFRSQPCKATLCKSCNNIEDNVYFYSQYYKKQFFLTSNLDCSSKNIIYLITCNLCKIQYVGETGRQMRLRLTQHRHDIKVKNLTPIGIHFNKKNHTLSHLNIIPIETIESDKVYQRKTREYYWQLRLGTIFPKGLNNFPVNDTLLVTNDTLTTAQDYENLINLRDMELRE